MSLKRYAIIAAVSYHNSQQEQRSSTTTTTTTKPIPAFQKLRQQKLLKAITTTTMKPSKIATKSMHTINAPATTTATAAATSAPIVTNWFALNTLSSSNSSNSGDNDSGNNHIVSDENLTTTTILGNTNTGGSVSSSSSSGGGGGVVSSNSITTYYGGGLGLFHQQNLRANGVGGGLINANGNTGSVSGSGVSYPNTINGNVNLLLGGAMLSLVMTILCVVCYCCHRNIKKRTEAAYRQQRQWLENDPNMEIYSVEQCYETSGLFLGESTDGLSNIPALHHEPPPSYDAVVAMQEQLLQEQQQQQLQLLQQQQQQQQNRTSPPPGYRSTIDVSAMVQTAFAATGPSTASSRGTLDDVSTNDSNGNLSSGTSINCNKYQRKPQQLTSLNPLLNMKKVLQAQSCCSLQRAEVENMWNAAAAAVAARNPQTTTRANEQPQSSNTNASTTTPTPTPTPTPAMLMMARKSLPTYAFGRHYRHQKSFYRRGCPLCGKFRYDAEDALSLSNESGLDESPAVRATTTNGQHRSYHKGDEEESQLELEGCGAQSRHFNENINNNNDQLVTHTTQNNNNNNNNNNIDVDDNDECLCDSSAATSRNRNQQQLLTTSFGAMQLQQNDYVNGNELLVANQFAAETNEPSDNVDNNANMEAPFDSAGGTQVTTSPATTSAAPNENINLNTINENGIVRLDMSKIFDKTGLPTYEAALKLDSSGYV